MFDEADMYLPATRKPPTKQPMENLLKRGRSAGLGVFLSTQSPGDLDYKCRDNVGIWFMGRISQDTAIKKLKPLFDVCRVSSSNKLAGQNVGEFQMARDSNVQPIVAFPSLLTTIQYPDDEIIRMARNCCN
jgi:DNA helicase HerA-like ATPase